jgi:hypothetical protein
MDLSERELLFRYLIDHLKKFRREMIAVHMAISTFSQPVQDEIKSRLIECREAESLEKMLNREFADFDASLRLLDESERDQALLRLLAQYKPTGKPN